LSRNAEGVTASQPAGCTASVLPQVHTAIADLASAAEIDLDVESILATV